MNKILVIKKGFLESIGITRNEYTTVRSVHIIPEEVYAGYDYMTVVDIKRQASTGKYYGKVYVYLTSNYLLGGMWLGNHLQADVTNYGVCKLCGLFDANTENGSIDGPTHFMQAMYGGIDIVRAIVRKYNQL